MNSVRLLKVLLVVVPFMIVIIVLRGLGDSCRERGLPDGYGKIAESKRWVVYGPVDDEDLAGLGDRLDAFRRAFHETYADVFHLVDNDDVLSLYLFRRHAEFSEYAKAGLTDDTDRITGYYWPGSWKIVAVVPNGRGLATFRHESVHAILDRDVVGEQHAWSPWLNEGLAQAFEEPSVEGGRLRPGPPHVEQAHIVLRAYRDGRLPTVLDFTSLGHGQFMARAELHYAYAAVLVLYLMHEYWSDFVWYFDRERAPGPISPSVLALRFDRDLRPDLIAWLAAQVR